MQPSTTSNPEEDDLLRAKRVVEAAEALFDNRLGWSNGRNPYAPRELWADLGRALYGEDDQRVKDLSTAEDRASYVDAALDGAWIFLEESLKAVMLTEHQGLEMLAALADASEDEAQRELTPQRKKHLEQLIVGRIRGGCGDDEIKRHYERLRAAGLCTELVPVEHPEAAARGVKTTCTKPRPCRDHPEQPARDSGGDAEC